jgi:DNA-directed RNA polymerase II subunit RPB7
MWLTQLWRYWTAPWCTTQFNLNRVYQRPKFTLAERYGQCMTVIFTSITLFAAAPVLIPASALYCLLAYWSDKTMILRHSRYPSLYDHKLAKQFLTYVPLACLAHFAFASWAFSQWDIPSYFLTGLDGWAEEIYDQRDHDFWTVRANMTKYEQLDFKERFYRVNGLIQLIAFVGYLLFLFIKALLSGLGKTTLYLLGCQNFGESEWKADVQFNDFSEVRDNAIKGGDDKVSLSGLPSYRVQDNPEYSALFPESRKVDGAFDDQH